jgi:hypothetical protein
VRLPDRGFGAEYLGSSVTGGGNAERVRLLTLGGIASVQRKRLRRRLDDARRVAHPNLEPVLDLIDDRGSLVLVSEAISGVTLQELLARHPGLLDARLRRSLRKPRSAYRRCTTTPTGGSARWNGFTLTFRRARFCSRGTAVQCC